MHARFAVRAAMAATVLAFLVVSCSSNGGAKPTFRSEGPDTVHGVTSPPAEGEPTPTPAPTPSPVVEPPPPPEDGGGGGVSGITVSGSYEILADRLIVGGGELLAVAPRVWIGATRPAKFPKGSFLATGTGAYLSKGGAWTNASSRSLKDHVRPVSDASVLRALMRLPVSTWHYRSEAAAVRHMGPMAEDFSRLFHLGGDPRHIATVDEEGVALAALRALAARSAGQRAVIGSLRARLSAQGARFSALERREARLERLVRALAAGR
ncbi:MAG TPA: tail fiber domain-containing protein [Actinomycetota bacterium]